MALIVVAALPDGECNSVRLRYVVKLITVPDHVLLRVKVCGEEEGLEQLVAIVCFSVVPYFLVPLGKAL